MLNVLYRKLIQNRHALGNILVVLILFLFLIFFYIFDINAYLESSQDILALKFRDFLTLFFAIIVESFPFVVLGVIISVLVGVFVKEGWLLKILPQNKFLRHLLIAVFGIFMPVCECGNIPVARRLISKGFSTSEAMTFLFAAPIINPVTFISTYEAFRLTPAVLWTRMGAGLFIAVFIGILFSFYHNQKGLLTENFIESCKHDHEHFDSKLNKSLEIFQTEFITVEKMLVFGAVIAAASQIFIPRDVIISIGTNPFLSVIAMVILAFVISICSNVDAFFALTYANTFTGGAIVAFLVFGPMIDIKILAMLKTTFKTSVLIRVTMLVTAFSILIGLIYNFFG